jgi:hypothetical protein
VTHSHATTTSKSLERAKAYTAHRVVTEQTIYVPCKIVKTREFTAESAKNTAFARAHYTSASTQKSPTLGDVGDLQALCHHAYVSCIIVNAAGKAQVCLSEITREGVSR